MSVCNVVCDLFCDTGMSYGTVIASTLKELIRVAGIVYCTHPSDLLPVCVVFLHIVTHEDQVVPLHLCHFMELGAR